MVRLSHQGLLVLKVFRDSLASENSGAEIINKTGLLSGTVYPILLRFEQLGLLESRWEEAEPRELKRPRRRLYHLTSKGAAIAERSLGQLASDGVLAPMPGRV